MPNIRAKFRVDSISRSIIHNYDQKTQQMTPQEVQTVKMNVTYDPAFHGSTPWGGVELSLVKEEHARHFHLGKEYFADFTPVEPQDDAA